MSPFRPPPNPRVVTRASGHALSIRSDRMPRIRMINSGGLAMLAGMPLAHTEAQQRSA